MTFSGTGTTSVTDGGSNELDMEPDDSLKGVVRAKGAYGLDWLAVEKVQTRNFDQIALKKLQSKATTARRMSIRVFDLFRWWEP